MSDPHLIDITPPIRSSMPVYPGNPGVSVRTVRDVREGAHSTLSEVTMGTHTGTHVDAQLVKRDLLFTLVLSRQMDRSSADHTWDHAFADQDLFANQLPHIQAPNKLKTEYSVSVVCNDHKPDLVHVRVEHDLETVSA